MARALRRRKLVMAYVIASTCIDVKDGACQEACPVDAIYASEDLPDTECAFERANAEFFGPAITGWGSPGGADSAHASALDHPLVAKRAK
jgi:NAD-dependent dihydropyrimidine dehydrogenase PreA subunit